MFVCRAILEVYTLRAVGKAGAHKPAAKFKEGLHAPPFALYAQKIKLWMPISLKYSCRPCMYWGSQCGRKLASGTPQRPSGLLLVGFCSHTAGSYICALPVAPHARPTVFVGACQFEALNQLQVVEQSLRSFWQCDVLQVIAFVLMTADMFPTGLASTFGFEEASETQWGAPGSEAAATSQTRSPSRQCILGTDGHGSAAPDNQTAYETGCASPAAWP